MEIEAPAILLTVTPYGEGDAVAALFTAADGVFRGLARGGRSRAGAATWQAGNLLQVRWVARLADQLGSVSAELVHAAAAAAMADPIALAVLSSACAVAAGALPERQPYPAIFRGLLHVIAHVGDPAAVAELVRWELGLLRELGYGLDLSTCALTGGRENLAYVSPRTGRAVCAEAAGPWRTRLLRLPPFLAAAGATTCAVGNPADWADGLALTGHFLSRDVFGLRHHPLPAPRLRLAEGKLTR